MNGPGFFIAGAAKCGTTALYRYLRAHPAIFMPDSKEPHHFDTDLHVLDAVRDRSAYLDLFRPAARSQLAGEATGGYLYSRVAASAIRTFNPDARILILLRHPVDAIHAMHQHQLYAGQERLRDLGEALEAEAERREGRRIPAGCRFRESLFYRDRARYAGQVARFLDTFGPARVRIMLQEDLRRRTTETYAGTLRFLQVDDGFRPSFTPVNPGRAVRHLALHRLAMGAARSAVYPIARRLLPAAVRRAYWSVNLHETTIPMDPRLRARLDEEFAPEIDRLAALLGRDLGAWHRGEEVPG